MSPLREFIGGPWDGEFKNIEHGNAVHLHLGTMPDQVVAAKDREPMPLEEPRIGVYELRLYPDFVAPIFQWQGEQ